MKLLHISLNTAHSGCKPCTFMASFTVFYTLSCPRPYTSPPPPPHFYKPTPNRLHSNVPNAKPISICHASPPQPHSEYQEDCTRPHFASYPSEALHAHPSHHRTLCSLQAMQILSLHYPLLSPICHHTLDTGPKNLSFYVIYDACGHHKLAVRMGDSSLNLAQAHRTL